jgi:hypothetical protein
MKLIDPTSSSPSQNNQRAQRLHSLANKRIGLLSNGKANARSLLLKTAEIFRDKDGCEIADEMIYKTNASAPAERQAIEALAAQSDFLITANGD